MVTDVKDDIDKEIVKIKHFIKTAKIKTRCWKLRGKLTSMLCYTGNERRGQKKKNYQRNLGGGGKSSLRTQKS